MGGGGGGIKRENEKRGKMRQKKRGKINGVVDLKRFFRIHTALTLISYPV
jgi:hypothetical protein